MYIRIDIYHRIVGLDLIIAALGIDPRKIAEATEALRASNDSLAASVAAASSHIPPTT